jgi:hypothetical protein
MDEIIFQRLASIDPESRIKEKSPSKRATCFVCNEKIVDEERFAARGHYRQSSYRYIHLGCFEEVLRAQNIKEERERKELAEIPEKMKKEKLDEKVLQIWPSRESTDYWTPKFGEIFIPDGWDFLPAGNLYLTKNVKNLGPYWEERKKRDITTRRYKGPVSTIVGIWAPIMNIEKAEYLETQTEANRLKKRETSRIYRDQKEEKYRGEFKKGVIEFLDFAPSYEIMAEEIAEETSNTACEKNSGRVGRTGNLPLEEKVKLAVYAHIRHNYTDYDEKLRKYRELGLDKLPEDMYRSVKSSAAEKVDEFIIKHRAADESSLERRNLSDPVD